MITIALIWFVGVIFFYMLDVFFGGIMGNNNQRILIFFWPFVLLYRTYCKFRKK
jgi:hypothetical protein